MSIDKTKQTVDQTITNTKNFILQILKPLVIGEEGFKFTDDESYAIGQGVGFKGTKEEWIDTIETFRALLGKSFGYGTSVPTPTEKFNPFSISVNDWVTSDKFDGFNYQVSIAVPNVAENDFVKIIFDPASVIIANKAYVLSSGTVDIDTVILYAQNIPENSLSGIFSITKGGAM